MKPNKQKTDWDTFVKENHTSFSKDANGIKYEFYEEDLLKFIQQQREEIIKEIEGKLPFLTRYERSKFRVHLEGPLEDELEIMLLEEDVKNLLEKK